MTETTARRRGADALMATLKAAGVERVFTLSGNHIMPVFDAAFDAGMALVHTRHEAAAVHMADAFARLTGQVGVALVTGGPGHANAVSALYTAQMNESPVVLLSGHAPHGQLGMGAFQEMQQADMAKPVCKASWTCADAASVATDLAEALRIARSGRPGPVHLSLPTDVLDGAVGAWPGDLATRCAAEAMPLDAAVARELMQALVGASRPLVLAGPACMTRAGRARLAALQAASGVPVVGMDSPRGIADPRLGDFAAMLAQADAVLLLGKRLDFTLKFGQVPPWSGATRLMQVDADEGEFERTRRAVGPRLARTAQADAFSALDALVSAAQGGLCRNDRAWVDEFDAAIRWRPEAWTDAEADSARHPSIPSGAARLHPLQMLAPLQALLDSHADSVLVCDGGEIGQWAAARLDAPHRIINGVAGAIGSGLPYALAARCAVPEAPVVAVMGDGTAGFHIAEFDTAVRHGLHFVAVIGNDARWNAEHQIQLREYGAARLIGCELLPSRYDEVARAFGGYGECVDDARSMAGALQRAVHSALPACLNVMIEGLVAPVLARPR
ncbi:MAG: thiamine pyrophosphate-binding protein [Gammaproteobacteria bacterium]|nr:thiamine pyrophosphate-binding protein [Gammaproteobacteria bacterium]